MILFTITVIRNVLTAKLCHYHYQHHFLSKLSVACRNQSHLFAGALEPCLSSVTVPFSSYLMPKTNLTTVGSNIGRGSSLFNLLLDLPHPSTPSSRHRIRASEEPITAQTLINCILERYRTDDVFDSAPYINLRETDKEFFIRKRTPQIKAYE